MLTAGEQQSNAAVYLFKRASGALSRSWHWLVVGAALGWFGGLAWKAFLQGNTYSAEIAVHGPSLPLSASPEAGGKAAASQLKSATRLASDESLLRRAAARGLARPLEDALLRSSEVRPDADENTLTLRFRTDSPVDGLRLMDAWTRETLAVLEQQASEQEAAQMLSLTSRLVSIDRTLASLGQELAALGAQDAQAGDPAGPFALLRKSQDLEARLGALAERKAALDLQILNLNREVRRLSPALVAARDELSKALTRYTDEHPKVKELRATLAELEARAAAEAGAAATDSAPAPGSAGGALYAQLLSLQNERLSLARELDQLQTNRTRLPGLLVSSATNSVKHTELQARFEVLSQERLEAVKAVQSLRILPAGGGGRFSLLRPARLENRLQDQWQAHLAAGGVGLLAGLLAMMSLALLVDVTRWRLYSTEDLRRASGLPVLGTLKEIDRLSAAEQEQWAFQTFTRLKGRLTRANEEALVCGVISVRQGEGRSTVARLLTAAAAKQGYRSLVVAAGGSPKAGAEPAPAPAADGEDGLESLELGTSLVPARISEAVRLPPAVRSEVQLSASELTLELRAQWRDALQQAEQEPRLVLIADLPPATSQQGVLLAESVPNLLWVAECGRSRFAETAAGIALLKDSRCNLVGAIMNTIPRSSRRRRWSAARIAGLLALLLWPQAGGAQAQPAAAPAAAPPPLTNAVETLSVSAKPAKLASWQERLTLGPGDVMNISIFGQKETTRENLVVGPDGRINYMEARDVVAAGLTVDELRSRLEGILEKYHRSPKVLVHPVSYQSKKFYLLGNVVGRGVYQLDRPVTIIEAVASAKGFAGESQVRGGPPPAEFSRSFLIRRKAEGGFGPVNVDLEGLFQRGDLSQNLLLCPDDYLFFSALRMQEVYVLGNVMQPGILPYTKEMSLLAAIVAKGGFTTRGYKTQVLVVRGSLAKPQGTVINVNHILAARAPDFPLKNRDIVFVPERPTARLEELIEMAATEFVRTMAIGLAGENVGPFIKEPLF